jgi:hypothetical protein
MSRIVSGRLEHLSPQALLRLVSATSPSGILELDAGEATLRLEVDRGRVREPSEEQLRQVRRVLACRAGEFIFRPQPVASVEGKALSLTALTEAAEAIDTDTEIAAVLTDDLFDFQESTESARIHMLPAEPPSQSVEELLVDLEAEAAGQLLFANVGVVAQDPRFWRGSIERQWRQNGWRLQLIPMSEQFHLESFDLLVVHHQQATARTGREREWLHLVRRACSEDPKIPVIWVAPLADPDWVHRLIEAGVAFLMPAPRGDSGEAATRFAADLTHVVDRQLRLHQGQGAVELSASVSELVGAILSESDPDRGVRSLLQLAAERFSRGALFTLDDSDLRCRAGFGYPLDRNATVLPREAELVEQIVASGAAVMEVDPENPDVRRLAEACGVENLPAATALIPLGRYGSVAGVLVADCDGEELPQLDELVVLAGRLGGAAVI